MINNVDTSTRAYSIAMETFGAMALDQEPSQRLRYRQIAMEAVTGPDSGMVMDRLYKSIMGRASTNFGKIPDSEGDLTRFARYKGITETFVLLDKQMIDMNIPELAIAHALHDNIIRCREDFVYGFRVDSQYLKITYNSMVYALCELLNLCDVIYIDILRAIANYKQYQHQPYSNLLLVQNVIKFNTMVQSGEWAQIVSMIRKDVKGLCNVVVTADGRIEGGLLHFIAGAGGTSALGLGAAYAGGYAKTNNMSFSNAVTEILKNSAKDLMLKGSKTQVAANAGAKAVWGAARLGNKIAVIALAVIALLLVIRGLVFLFWSSMYKIHNILDDMANIVKANASSENAVTDPEKAKATYEALAALRDKIYAAIMKDDANAKKKVSDANKDEMSADNMTSSSTVDDDVDLG